MTRSFRITQTRLIKGAFKIDQKRSISWWYWIAGIDLVFIISTFLVPYLPTSISNGLVHHFHLAIEMNLAAWWSSITLFANALLAYQLFSNQEGRTRTVWLVLSLILVVFSLDEIGSFHERLPSFWDMLPFVGGIGILLAFALGSLFLTAGMRTTAVTLAVGFALLGSVFVQEILEFVIDWPAWARGLRVGIEEGTELLGIFLLFWGLSGALGRSRTAGSLEWVIPDPRRLNSWPAVLFSGLVLHGFISFQDVFRSHSSRLGSPVVWVPMAFFFFLFSGCLWNYFDPQGEKKKLWLPLSVYFLLSSAAVVYLVFPRSEVSRFNFLGLFSNFYFLYACQLVLITFLLWLVEPAAITKRIWIILLLALTLLVGFLLEGLVTQFITAGIFAYLTLNLFLYDSRLSWFTKPVKQVEVKNS